MLQEKQFIMNQGLRDGLLQYLSTKPFGEVHQAVNALYTLPEAEQVKNKQIPKDEIKTK